MKKKYVYQFSEGNAGMRELLGDSQFGLIVENDDEAFYLGMKRMLSDAELRCSYAEKSKQRGSDFLADTLTRNTEDFFMKLAGK